jgi:hypothetical protein
MTIAERETLLAGTHIAMLSVPAGHASLLIPDLVRLQRGW